MSKFLYMMTACGIALSPLSAFAADPFPLNLYLPAVIAGNPAPPAPLAPYTRSASGNIVTDTTSLLVWQDYYPSFKATEALAIVYCEQYSLDGYDDWRFPTFDELQVFFRGVAADPDFDLRHWGSFPNCTAAMAIGGYVRTPKGAEVYGGSTGDPINFSGGAAVRCVR